MEKNSNAKEPVQAPEQELTPQQEHEVKTYISILSKMLHGEKTKASVYEMLKAGDPMQTIPTIALQVNDQAEQVLKQQGGKPTLDTLVAGAQFLINDLVEIGNAGGFFEINIEDPNVAGPLLTNTMQPYIEKGLKDGSIDPVELQELVEPMMSEDARAQGMQIANENGMTESAGITQAVGTSNANAVRADRKVQDGQRRQAMGQPQQGVMQGGQS